MKQAEQEKRTFFISSRTAKGELLFRKAAFAELFIGVLLENRDKGRMLVHEFVVMNDHLHIILTPAFEQSLEKAAQFIKGGFSFRVKKELGYKWEVWQPSFNEHRIVDAEDYRQHVMYTRENPVRAGYVKVAAEYPYGSASGKYRMDEIPEHFRG